MAVTAFCAKQCISAHINTLIQVKFTKFKRKYQKPSLLFDFSTAAVYFKNF